MAENNTSKKGKPRSAGKRTAKIKFYYEFRYPEKKLRRIFREGGKGVLNRLKQWADQYKTPGGSSGNGALVKLSKELKFSL